MKNIFTPNSSTSVFRGILTITIGCVFLFVPGLTMQTVLIIIGSMLCLKGLITMILSNFKKTGSQSGVWSLQGIFNIIFGIIFISSPEAMIKVFVVFLGILLLMMGFAQLMGSLSTLSKSFWSWIFLMIALLTLAAGAYLFTDPFKSAQTILSFLGAILILNGISELLMTKKAGRAQETYRGAPIQDTTYEEL